jgi:carbamoyl-phosphate synthase large subunit
VVTKIPRFAFEKFPQANPRLTTQMKSVGEVMAIGRTFQESLQKALRGLETDKDGLDEVVDPNHPEARKIIQHELRQAGAERIFYLADAFRAGMSCEEIQALTRIDPWFLAQIEDLVRTRARCGSRVCTDGRAAPARPQAPGLLRPAPGPPDRRHRGGHPRAAPRVRACARSSSGWTPAPPSSPPAPPTCTPPTRRSARRAPSDRRKIMVLGGGPNRIGQGIEFDYCCVHAALALREDGFETIMVNCNPETVSTDYDTSDRLYFEPLTLEDVLEIVDKERPGVIVQYGGQTPLKLARALEANGVPIIGTSPDAIDRRGPRALPADGP